MPQLTDRHRTQAPPAVERGPSRPVVLATLSVRVDPSAERMAIASALEANVPLILTNLMELPSYPSTLAIVGPGGTTLPHEEDLDAVRATANRAAALGIKTELLRVHSRRPVKALLEILEERDAGLVVFGPDLGRTKRRRFRAAARKIREGARCLVWVAPDG